MTPATLPLQRYLVALHENLRALDHGSVATYIPQLAQADPDGFGICIVTTDGYAYAVGDSDVSFTMQSVSKPAVYAAALAGRGRDAVLRRVGVEPSGEAFNSISLDPQTSAPLNPMINAGAIATMGLVAGRPSNGLVSWMSSPRCSDGRSRSTTRSTVPRAKPVFAIARPRGCSRTSASLKTIRCQC